ncbi:MAG: BspA family leucine-rich repeat surface protein [Candidatus ainarchaeum sp.]|nr:BspA family leucine-rich repeat surface protein [Candidatus ainarchaeum sp.]
MFGTIQGWSFNASGDYPKITNISHWGGFNPKFSTNAFYGCSNLTSITATDILDLNGVTSLEGFFRNCSNVSYVSNMNNWDVSNINNMRNMFAYASNFNQDLSNWDVSNVSTMYYMFGRTKMNRNLSSWNVSITTDTSDMFYRSSTDGNVALCQAMATAWGKSCAAIGCTC